LLAILPTETRFRKTETSFGIHIPQFIEQIPSYANLYNTVLQPKFPRYGYFRSIAKVGGPPVEYWSLGPART